MGKKFIAALVIIYIIAALWVTQPADASVTAYINKTTWVYARPSTSSARVRVAKGTKVTVLAVRSSWARVKRSHYIGYIPTKYLSRKPTATPTPRPTAASRSSSRISSPAPPTTATPSRWANTAISRPMISVSGSPRVTARPLTKTSIGICSRRRRISRS